MLAQSNSLHHCWVSTKAPPDLQLWHPCHCYWTQPTVAILAVGTAVPVRPQHFPGEHVHSRSMRGPARSVAPPPKERPPRPPRLPSGAASSVGSVGAPTMITMAYGAPNPRAGRVAAPRQNGKAAVVPGVRPGAKKNKVFCPGGPPAPPPRPRRNTPGGPGALPGFRELTIAIFIFKT